MAYSEDFVVDAMLGDGVLRVLMVLLLPCLGLCV